MKYVTDYAEEETKVKVDDLLDEILNILEESKELPLVNKVMVEKGPIIDAIDEIRANMPQETRQAKAIVSDRTRILNTAKEEAEAIISVAEKRRNDMLNESDILNQAREEAERIVQEANEQAKAIRHASNKYVDDLMARTEDALAANLSDFQQKRRSILEAKKRKRQKAEQPADEQ